MEKDWLEGDSEEARQAQAEAGLVLAKNYLVFRQDPRAAFLLKQWEESVEQMVPAGSPIDAYARAEALRAFVNVIRRHIAIAERG